jgi:hypothetical protein
MFKEKLVKWFIYLVIIGMLTSPDWAMGRKPAESEQLAEVKKSSEKVKSESKLTKSQGIAKKGTETPPGTPKAPMEEYVAKVIIKARWGSGPGEFGLFKREMSGAHVMPNAIALDKEENLYILDPANGRVLKFTEDGEYIKAIYLEGRDKKYPFYIRYPARVHIALLGELVVDNKNNIYIYTVGKEDSILKFSKDGKFLQYYTPPEEMSFSNLCIINNKVTTEVYKGGGRLKFIELTPSGIIDLPIEISKKIEAEEKVMWKKIKFTSKLTKKPYTSLYGEIIGKDKDGNLYVRVEYIIKKESEEVEKIDTIQIYKYSPQWKLMSIFAERKYTTGTHKFVVSKDGTVYELLVPILDVKELEEPKAIYSPDEKLWGYAHYETTFPEYVKIIKWEKRK